MRGRFFAPAALLALAAAFPAASSPASAAQFKVASAKATATLTFHTETTSAVSDGKVALSAQRKSSARGSVPGRVLFPLKGKVTERVQIKQLEPGADEYVEKTCANSRKVGGRGGVTLRRVGSKMEVRWAFPQASSSFCKGPSVKSVTGSMKALYPASRFNSRRVTFTISGSKSVESGRTRFTYAWRATVTLTR